MGRPNRLSEKEPNLWLSFRVKSMAMAPGRCARCALCVECPASAMVQWLQLSGAESQNLPLAEAMFQHLGCC